jgi:hypothetical protein
MGGTVAGASQQQNQNTNQNGVSTTTPFAGALPAVNGILGNLQGVSPNLSPIQTSAIAQLEGLGAGGNPFQGGINSATSGLLSGGGANNQAPMLNNAYQNYLNTTSQFTNPGNLNPYETPGFGAALSTMNSDITNQINQGYAAAGRSLSDANSTALSRGLSQGEGALIQGQYNTNVGNLLGTAANQFGAGSSTANNLTNFNQLMNANEQAGIGAAGTAYQSMASGPLLQLQAASQQTGIPLQVLAAQAGIALPAGQAFGTTSSTGQGTSQGTTQNQTPLWQNLVGGLTGSVGLLGQTGAFGTGGMTPQGGTVNPGWLTSLFK